LAVAVIGGHTLSAQTADVPRSPAQALADVIRERQEFQGAVLILTDNHPCITAGGNCPERDASVPLLDRAALHAALPGSRRVHNLERGAAAEVIRANNCRGGATCLLIGVLPVPEASPSDTTLTLMLATQQVLREGQRRAIVSDYRVELRRSGASWSVASFTRTRVS
jgi:hypothetical protein